jgi:hypothetical protein
MACHAERIAEGSNSENQIVDFAEVAKAELQ